MFLVQPLPGFRAICLRAALRVNDYMFIRGTYIQIQSITDDNHLTLVSSPGKCAGQAW